MLKRIRSRSLFKAAERGNLKQVISLFEKGADLNIELHNETPLSRSIECGHKSVVEFLITHGARMPNEETDRNETPLHRAAKCGHLTVVQSLVELGANVNAKIHVHKKESNLYEKFYTYATPFHMAVQEKHLDVIKFLASHGANVNATRSYSSDASTPLIDAINKNDLEFIKLLLEIRVDVNARIETNGDTPLMCAIMKSNLAIVMLLVNHGADVNARNSVWCQEKTVLIEAVRRGCLPIVEYLIDKGAKDIDDALVSAAYHKDNLAIVKYLVHHGAKKIEDALRKYIITEENEVARFLAVYLPDLQSIITSLRNVPQLRATIELCDQRKIHSNTPEISLLMDPYTLKDIFRIRNPDEPVSPYFVLLHLCYTNIELFPESSLWAITELQDVNYKRHIMGVRNQIGYSGASPGHGGHGIWEEIGGYDIIESIMNFTQLRKCAEAELVRRLGSEKFVQISAKRPKKKEYTWWK
jgi:uncharacterized protein